jgi:hypothetical protein
MQGSVMQFVFIVEILEYDLYPYREEKEIQ